MNAVNRHNRILASSARPLNRDRPRHPATWLEWENKSEDSTAPPAFLCRKKKQAWGIALASAAGVAVAYYAYTWYTRPGAAEEVGNSDQGAGPTTSAEVTACGSLSRNSPGDAKSTTVGSLELEARIREQQSLLQVCNQPQK